jgi:pimeloyl-ACP methyl ester carboxylesterase
MSTKRSLIAALLAGFALSTGAAAAQDGAGLVKEIVLVHGAVLDGSGWRGVHDILVRKGFEVSVVQLPLTSLEADVAATRQILAQQQGPTVLVGHSYGGVVISAAGADPKVRALVYVAAHQPEAGESAADLNARFPLTAHPKQVGNSSMIVDRAFFRSDIAADLPAQDAAFLAASQRPTEFAIFTGKLPVAAWHSKPSFGIVATEDRSLHPDLLRFMYARSRAQVVEIKASHMVHMSKPNDVAAVIIRAAREVN